MFRESCQAFFFDYGPISFLERVLVAPGTLPEPPLGDYIQAKVSGDHGVEVRLFAHFI